MICDFAYWKMGLKDIEDMDFKYTTMSLNKVYAISYKHALATIKRNGGSVNGNNVTSRCRRFKALMSLVGRLRSSLSVHRMTSDLIIEYHRQKMCLKSNI